MTRLTDYLTNLVNSYHVNKKMLTCTWNNVTGGSAPDGTLLSFLGAEPIEVKSAAEDTQVSDAYNKTIVLNCLLETN